MHSLPLLNIYLYQFNGSELVETVLYLQYKQNTKPQYSQYV